LQPGNVDLKPLHEKSYADLRKMLERHVEYTGSPVAKRILDNWETETKKFVRVMPRDFAAVLKQRELDEQQLAQPQETAHAGR
jgi:glutamate synthase (NADPH/NADH) large chain